MPNLNESLQGRDLGHLRIIAGLWGVELSAPDARVGLQRLSPLLLERGLLSEVVQTLPEGASAALEDIFRNDGRMLWDLLIRRYGVVREMGAARRDRERPYQNATASATESLWYRALIGRAFFDTPTGPEEFAFIPDDLLALMPSMKSSRKPPLGRLATPAERALILLASDRILDDTCTMLAALRIRSAVLAQQTVKSTLEFENVLERSDFYALRSNPLLPFPLTARSMQSILSMAGLVDERGLPLPEPTRLFLEANRKDALLLLVQSWLRSADFNELFLVPMLVAEGAWRNDPLRARHAILDFLSTIPGGSVIAESQERPFWSISSLVAAVRQTAPDFQRTAGEYDTWYIRRQDSGENLRGFENWEAVEGELIRFIIAGPLHWLGIVDLGLPETTGQTLARATAFRFSAWAADLLSLNSPIGLAEENETIHANRDGRLHIPARAPRAVRYQAARFASWERYAQDSYHYRLTPASLEAARSQGLRVQHLIALLHHHTQAIPPGLLQALERWEATGSTARLDRALILRVKDPELLKTLRNTPLARYFGELLGPTTIIVRPAGWIGSWTAWRRWVTSQTSISAKGNWGCLTYTAGENNKIAGVILLLFLYRFYLAYFSCSSSSNLFSLDCLPVNCLDYSGIFNCPLR